MERTCKKCGDTKPIEEFVKFKDTYRNTCKKCANEYAKTIHPILTKEKQRLYRESHKIQIKKSRKNWYENNKEYENETSKEYCKNHRIRINELAKLRYPKYAYTEKYKIKNREYQAKYLAKNKEIINQKKRQWRKENPEKEKMFYYKYFNRRSKYRKAYYKDNLDKIKKYRESDIVKEKEALQVKELYDVYVISTIKRLINMTSKEIRKCPELIELKRAQLKLNRLI